MYNPSFNKITNLEEIKGFVKNHPFGLIISSSNDKPVATHLPFHLEENDQKLTLYSHFAKANHHWKILEAGKNLVVFSEPHAYISPSFYENVQSVPTWNYAVVQVYGMAAIIKDELVCKALLRKLIAEQDAHYLDQWDHTIDENYKNKMLTGIVMFKLEVVEVHAKYKLSQNKTKDEQQRISNSLQKSPQSNIREVGELMSKSIEDQNQ